MGLSADTADFIGCINFGVHRSAFVPMAWRSEIDTTEQFPHEHQIYATHHFRTNIGTVGEWIEHINRPKVGVVAKQGAQIEKPAFRLFRGGQAVVFAISDCAKKHGL